MQVSLIRLVPFLVISSLYLAPSLQAAPAAQDVDLEPGAEELVARDESSVATPFELEKRQTPKPSSQKPKSPKGRKKNPDDYTVNGNNFDTTPDNRQEKAEFQKESAEWGKDYVNTLVYDKTGKSKDPNYIPQGVAWQLFNTGKFNKKNCAGKYIQMKGPKGYKNVGACSALEQREKMYAKNQKNGDKNVRPGTHRRLRDATGKPNGQTSKRQPSSTPASGTQTKPRTRN